MPKLTTTAMLALSLACLLPTSASADPVNSPTTLTGPISCTNATTDESFTGTFSVNSGASGDNPNIITWSPLFITSEAGARHLLRGTSVSITITDQQGNVIQSASFAKNREPAPWACSTSDLPLGGGLFFTATATGDLTARG